jgi:hypothetical protein
MLQYQKVLKLLILGRLKGCRLCLRPFDVEGYKRYRVDKNGGSTALLEPPFLSILFFHKKKTRRMNGGFLINDVL